MAPSRGIPGAPTATDARGGPTRIAPRARAGCRLRERMAREGVDGYFGLRWEQCLPHGPAFDESEVAGSGESGKFLVGMSDVWLIADSRYTIAARREAPDTTLYEVYAQLYEFWADLVATAGVKRVAVEAMTIPHLTWERLRQAAPGVELLPVEGWVEAQRQHKEPSELERVAAASAVADRALAALLPSIRPGVTEIDLALDLEWRMRTGGADRLAFDVACLSGAEAALPHGSPRRAPSNPVRCPVRLGPGRGLPQRHDTNARRGEPRDRDRARCNRVVAAAQDVVLRQARSRVRRRQAGEISDGTRDGTAGPRRDRGGRALPRLRPRAGPWHRPWRRMSSPPGPSQP